MPLHLPQVPTRVLQRCWTSLKKECCCFYTIFSWFYSLLFQFFFFATFPLFLIKQCHPVYTSNAYVQVFICMHRWAIICRYSSLHLHRKRNAYSQLTKHWHKDLLGVQMWGGCPTSKFRFHLPAIQGSAVLCNRANTQSLCKVCQEAEGKV